MTFGEVVSSYSTFGSSAAKRRNYMVHHQETHLPDARCTIHDKVRLLDKESDPLSLGESSSRGLLTPRWSTTRSRTPSPWMRRRPRSIPGTPRASTPGGMRRSDSRERYFRDPAEYCDIYPGENIAGAGIGDSKFDGLSRRNERVPAFSSAHGVLASDYGIPSTCAIGADNARGTSSGAGAVPLSSAAIVDNMGTIGAGSPPPRTPPLHSKGIAYDYYGSRSGAGGSLAHSGLHTGYRADALGKPQQPDARSASFVRLNSFLLRTHVTSLVSALAEDGWLEIWEKERLCCQAREDSLSWMQAFFRSYTRLIETEDVKTFVAGLRSQIV